MVGPLGIARRGLIMRSETKDTAMITLARGGGGGEGGGGAHAPLCSSTLSASLAS
jgi:hypothetical protein